MNWIILLCSSSPLYRNTIPATIQDDFMRVDNRAQTSVYTTHKHYVLYNSMNMLYYYQIYSIFLKKIYRLGHNIPCSAIIQCDTHNV